jgi:hypothetical protein
MMILTICTAVAVAGGGLLLLGLRGRRVGDHPFCRRCGFDLFGRPEGSMTCPECGADLARARATVIGTRQRRRWPALGGAMLLVPSLAVGLLTTSGALRGLDWQKSKPTWYLLRETHAPDAATRLAALNELHARLTVKQLDRRQVGRLVDRVMAVQADASQPWVNVHGDIIELARANGHVDHDQWVKYAERSVANFAKLDVRPRVRRGDPAVHVLRCEPPRLGGQKSWAGIVRIRGLVLDEQEAPLNEAINTGLAAVHRERPQLPGFDQLLPLLGDGMRHGYLTVEVSLIPPDKIPAPTPRAAIARGRLPTTIPRTPAAIQSWQNAQLAAMNDAREKAMLDAALTTVQLRLPVDIEITPADQPGLKPVADDKLRAAVERSIAVDSVHIGVPRAIAVQVKWKAPPVDLSFRVGVRDGARYWPVATLACRAGERKTVGVRTDYIPSEELEGDAVDVLFTPEPSAGARTIDVHSYWDREVVVKDVAVTRSAGKPPPRARPH